MSDAHIIAIGSVIAFGGLFIVYALYYFFDIDIGHVKEMDKIMIDDWC